jgi:hypothetical protein
MSQLKHNAEALQGNLSELLESQAEFYKLWSFKVAMKSVTLGVHIALIAVFSVLALLFLSVAAAYGLAGWLGHTAYGFLAVGGFYLLFALSVYWFRDRIDRPVLRKFSEIFFTD